jgi:Inner membrane protein YgaP-like, transmembrane domain
MGPRLRKQAGPHLAPSATGSWRAAMGLQTGNLSTTERATSVLWGLSLSLVAMRRGNPFWRIVSGVAGAALLARSYAGYCGVKAALAGEASVREGLAKQWDRMWSPAGDEQGGQAQVSSEQAIDCAVDDSFPASDPPASRLPDEPPSNAQAKWEAARATERSAKE